MALTTESSLASSLAGQTGAGGMIWTLPKGHIEVGERAEQTAIREIAEETGIRGDVLAALGSIDFWFRAEHHVVHKTVHHYLLRFVDGQPSANDHEGWGSCLGALDEPNCVHRPRTSSWHQHA